MSDELVKRLRAKAPDGDCWEAAQWIEQQAALIAELESAQSSQQVTPCVHANEPKACYRVRCQLGNKCVDDDMSPRVALAQAKRGG